MKIGHHTIKVVPGAIGLVSTLRDGITRSILVQFDSPRIVTLYDGGEPWTF